MSEPEPEDHDFTVDRLRIEKTASDLHEFYEDILIMICIRLDHPYNDELSSRQVLYSGRGHHWARMGIAMEYICEETCRSDVDNTANVEAECEQDKYAVPMTQSDRDTLNGAAAELNEWYEEVLIAVCKRNDEDEIAKVRRRMIYCGRGHPWARLGMVTQYVIDHAVKGVKQNNYDE